MYKVLTGFFDLEDQQHYYPLGASYPREGLTVSEKRINDLSTANNRMGFPLIEKVEEEKKSPRKRVKKDAD